MADERWGNAIHGVEGYSCGSWRGLINVCSRDMCLQHQPYIPHPLYTYSTMLFALLK